MAQPYVPAAKSTGSTAYPPQMAATQPTQAKVMTLTHFPLQEKFYRDAESQRPTPASVREIDVDVLENDDEEEEIITH